MLLFRVSDSFLSAVQGLVVYLQYKALFSLAGIFLGYVCIVYV